MYKCRNAQLSQEGERACGVLYGLSDAVLLYKQAIIGWKSFSDMTAKDLGDGLLPKERVILNFDYII